MRQRRRLAMVVSVALIMGGCSLVDLMAQIGTNARPLAKDDWGSDWQPLQEVVPPEVPEAAELNITYVDRDVSLGTEGALLFAKLTSADGTVVMDQRVTIGGSTHHVPPGDYRLTSYYRSCDGNCDYLDPPNDFCSIALSLAESERYGVEVSVANQKCTLADL